VDGALVSLLCRELGIGLGYLSDWLEHDRDTITLWHGGNGDPALCEPVGTPCGPRTALHFNTRKPGVLDASLRADQPVTLLRIWQWQDGYRMAAVEGQTLPPRRPLAGTNGLVRIDGRNVNDLFDRWVHAGMSHHVTVLGGRRREILRRLARMLKMEWID
jgi:L-arabinose isomerase